jgi:hypothetical protein
MPGHGAANASKRERVALTSVIGRSAKVPAAGAGETERTV